ncbi:hypothetical protein Ana3638_05775 [Anaerocolumna sedimenticola]|uniref:Bacterial Ig-like domain-containing protein n=1 Tax=Anaerocolumna sedimenticola TaxID=2696063 RepID=A0A6P1TJW0_9FIRM|nr:immunoglobulin-like domain-containing protein [Anaerocolumna sedimenticola]QHQ60341.1 hypothetical protein Ana3638_05775 [Anaerocolumna sedimenticola]
MNENRYNKSMDSLKISEDFNNRTALKMKAALREQTGKKYPNLKKYVLSAASVAVIIAAGTAAMNLTNNSNNFSGNGGTGAYIAENTVTTESAKSQGITVPVVEIPAQNTQVKARMLPLFVYKGHIYVQSATSFETPDGMTLNKDEVLSLRGDYLGKTKGSIDEWSSQADYAKEFASTIGEGDVYTVKGYNPDHRLMVYYEYQDGGFGCELYDSYGGMTLNSGADYFNLLNLKGNVLSYQWESYNSWNNGMNEVNEEDTSDVFNTFLDSLYTSVPIGENIDMLTENTDYDSQKFVDIKTKDHLITSLRLFKGGYVYDSQVGFFKVDDAAFNAFWNTMPVTDPAAETATSDDTAADTSINLTLKESSLPVGSKELKINIENTGTVDIFYGADFSIEKLNGSSWKTVPGVKDLAFIEIAYSVAPAASQEFTVDLSKLNPSLDAGNYRLVKTINGQTFYAEFQLTK